MSRQRRGRRKPSGDGQKSRDANSIPSSHKAPKKGSGRRSKGSSRPQKRGQSKNKSSSDSIAPSPLVALHKIQNSSPVGTGKNPSSSEFHDSSNEKQKKPAFYKVLFFDTFKSAKQAFEEIKTRCSGCDQLNIVIKAEGNMEDPELLSIDGKVKVFAGEAWSLIHKRREEEGWYEAAQ